MSDVLFKANISQNQIKWAMALEADDASTGKTS